MIPQTRMRMSAGGRDEIGVAKGRSMKKTRPRYGLPERAWSGLPKRDPYVVLGIESSCDDTAAAVVRSDGVILSESVVSQHAIHAEWGGVVPNLAKQAHEKAMDGVVKSALNKAGIDMSEIDVVAATYGPGLEICLRVGATHAADLARTHDKVFVQAHHLEAHCFVAMMTHHIQFPYLSLLVSGGHCQILQCNGVGQFKFLGGTLDDALGEAYDKAARMLRLQAPTGGGPALEAVALQGDPKKVPLPVPMQRRKDCDFSYAGLKNALRIQIEAAREKHPELQEDDPLPLQETADIAASFQDVAIRHLEDRLNLALDQLPLQGEEEKPVLAVVGGVAANAELRRRIGNLCDKRGWRLVVPPPRLCTDNGVMIAWSAIEKLKLGISNDPNDVDVYARWPFRQQSDNVH